MSPAHSSPPACDETSPLASLHPARLLRTPLPEPWRTLLVLGVLFFGFWMLYFHMGLAMEKRGTLRNNTFFHSDIGRVISDMTKAEANHGRTIVHPLFVLFTQPAAAGLAKLCGSPARVAMALNSAVGALAAVVTCLFFLLCRQTLRRSLLGALVLGLSASHLYFGSAPETYSFSSLSIMLLAMGVAAAPPRGWRWFLPAGLFSFGILVTNLAFAAIIFAAALPWTGWWRHVRRVALLTAAVVALGVILALGQKALWPSCQLFFAPRVVESEGRFTTHLPTVAKVLEREGELLRYVFVYDFFAPNTYIDQSNPGKASLQIHARSLSHYPLAGKLATALWLTLLLAALWRTARARLVRQPLHLCLAGCLLYNFLLHTLYGDDLFLYSANTCFLVVAWAILAVSDWKTPRAAALIDWNLCALVTFEVINNARFIKALTLMRYTGP